MAGCASGKGLPVVCFNTLIAPLLWPTSNALLIPTVEERLMTFAKSSRQWTWALLKALSRIPKHQIWCKFCMPWQHEMQCNSCMKALDYAPGEVLEDILIFILTCAVVTMQGQVLLHHTIILKKVAEVREDRVAALPDTDFLINAEVDLLRQGLTIDPKKATLPRDKKIDWSDLLGAVR